MAKEKYLALLWKVWRVSLKSYIQIPICILIPILFAGALAYVKTTSLSSTTVEPAVIYRPDSWRNMSRYAEDKNMEILYTPNNSETNRIMTLAPQLLRPIGIKLLKGVKDEISMEKYFADEYSNSSKIFLSGLTGYGVIFHSTTKNSLSYTLRNTNNDIWRINQRFPVILTPGPSEAGSMYLSEGFIPLQIAINVGFMMKLQNVTVPEGMIEEFPYPPYVREGSFELINLQLLPMVFIIGFLYMFINLSTGIVREKNSGAREMMKLSGLNMFMIYFYWFIFYFIQCFIAIVAISILLKIDLGSKAVLQYSNVLILVLFFLLFCINGIFFVFVIASFFQNPKYQFVLTLLIWVAFYTLFSRIRDITSTTANYFTIFMPIGALLRGVETIAALETSREGIGFTNLFFKTPNTTQVPVGFSMLGMIISTLLCLPIFAYLDAIKPGAYGIAKPWHFIFPEFLKRFCKVDPNEEIKQPPSRNKLIEKTDLPVGIKISRVTKNFGALTAVNDLSMDIYKNQITALLGHNGAGKTTLISILTGMFSPTRGEIYVEGKNIFSNFEEFRQNIGYCPQHDLLLPDLTVYEHMIFFGLIKGLSRKQADDRAHHIMGKFSILAKKNVLVSQLSGGMKRKLCLSIALVNDPKVLFLDEPTSGLDPQSRRDIWNILLTYRGNRTILITTHFMEEADALGDGIAIMSHGEVCCYGSALYLKKHFGSGYHITLTYADKFQTESISRLIKNHLPTCVVEHNEQLQQIKFAVPMDESEHLPNMFLDLQNAKLQLKIGVMCTSLDDVFLNVQKGEGVLTEFDETDFPSPNDPTSSSKQLNTGLNLIMQQIFSLVWKRLLWLRKNWFFFVLYIVLLPFLFTFFAVKNSNTAVGSSPTPLLLELAMYGKTTSIISGSDSNKLVKFLIGELHKQGSKEKLTQTNTQQALLNAGVADETNFRTSMIVSADLLDIPTVFYSSLAIHAPSIATNMLFSLMMKNKSDIDVSFNTFNFPYEFNAGICSVNSMQSFAIIVLWLMTFSLGCLVAFTYFITFPIIERVNLIKHLQYMAGLRSITYWTSTFLADILFFAISLLVIFITIHSVDSFGMFSQGEFPGYLTLITLLFGVNSILLAYLASFVFRTNGTGSSVITFGSIIFTIFGVGILPLLTDSKYVEYVTYIIPWTPFNYALIELLNKARLNYVCSFCSTGPMQIVCNQLNNPDKSLFGLIKTDLIFMIVDAILFAVLITVIELGLLKMVYSFVMEKYYGGITYTLQQVDSDVKIEKDRVDAVTSPNVNNDDNAILVVDSFGKKYKRNFTSVYDVSFAVTQGECFGLLGVNGAGKTTTFSMLVGLIKPSKGNAKINWDKEYSLAQNQFQFLKNIGYCPQENVLIEDLTARQMLHLIASLRGVQSSNIKRLTEKWINLLDLEIYADRPCGTYSGGNKRKLCAAMAFIGDPPVILLDEPTTGVDPVSRRKLWKVLKHTQSNDQTIVITSHSMEECEAVCDRLTIMVEGYMQCIGTVQYLKQKYAQGFSLLIKLEVNCSDEELNQIKEEVDAIFGPNCCLKDEHKGLLHYHIADKTFQWAYLFGKMNDFKKKHYVILDYMLSDTSLEEVFLSFAK